MAAEIPKLARSMNEQTKPRLFTSIAMHLPELLPRLKHVKKHSGNSWTACCPAHKDKRPSLSVTERAGTILLFCFAGCSITAICSSLGIKVSDLCPKSSSGQTIADAYDYRDENGDLLYQVLRYPGKKFLQRRPDGKDGWIWNLKDIRRVLYRLPELPTLPQS